MRFNVVTSHGWSKDGWVIRFKLQNSDRLSSVIESNERWDTEAEAKVACDRANAGDKAGLTFSSFADD